MSDTIRCPNCRHEFEAAAALREHIAAEVRESLLAEATSRIEAVERRAAEELAERTRQLEAERKKLDLAAHREAELIKKERELGESAREAALEFERRLGVETTRIREREAKVAEARFAEKAAEDARLRDAELEEARRKLGEASAREHDLLKRQRELDDRERDAALEVERKVAAEAGLIREREAKLAEERFAARVAEVARLKDVELDEAKRKVEGATAREAELLKRERELVSREQEAALANERKLNEEAAKIREAAAAATNERVALEREKMRLSEEEHRQRTEQMQRQLEELQQRLQRGPQQLQGEAQEVVLRELLVGAFPHDVVDDVPKGVQGADLVQRVRDGQGVECGVIVWESKRTIAWSEGWLAKLRDDQRLVGASIAVIVSQTLPADVPHFAQRAGVWVCGWPYAAALAGALRHALRETSKARAATEGRDDKLALVYDYLTGPEFRNRVSGLVEAIAAMKQDLDGERLAMTRLWKKREKQIERAYANLGTFYGDLQGISGAQLADIPAMSLGAIAALPAPRLGDEGDDDAPAYEGELDREDELVALLVELLPPVGESVGNGALRDRLRERAEPELGVAVDEAIYARCKDVLLARGVVKRGAGRGGSVVRVR